MSPPAPGHQLGWETLPRRPSPRPSLDPADIPGPGACLGLTALSAAPPPRQAPRRPHVPETGRPHCEPVHTGEEPLSLPKNIPKRQGCFPFLPQAASGLPSIEDSRKSSRGCFPHPCPRGDHIRFDPQRAPAEQRGRGETRALTHGGHAGHGQEPDGARAGRYLMSSSVTMKALQRGWAVFSHTPGFFSTAAESCPVMGMVLVCRALAMADSRVSSVQPGPTPTRGQEGAQHRAPEAALPQPLVSLPSLPSQAHDPSRDSSRGCDSRLRRACVFTTREQNHTRPAS